MPLRIRCLHCQLVRDLALSRLRETFERSSPGFGFALPGDDSDSYTGFQTAGAYLILFRWPLGIFHGYGSDGFRCGYSRFRGSRNQETRLEFRRKRWPQFRIVDLVERAFETDRCVRRTKSPYYRRIFNQPFIAAVVRNTVVEARQGVNETAYHHVQINPPPVNTPEGTDHFRDAVRV